jgi:hypothetical protein
VAPAPEYSCSFCCTASEAVGEAEPDPFAIPFEDAAGLGALVHPIEPQIKPQSAADKTAEIIFMALRL